MAFKFIILAAIVAVSQAGLLRSDILPASTLAIDHGSAHLGESHYVPSEGSNPAYEFKYGVHDSHTGDSKSAHEIRNGDFVQGTYSVNDADGTRRTVDYTATPFTGFEATVSKEPIIGAAVEPILAKKFVEAPASARFVDYPEFLERSRILPAPAAATIIEPHSFARLALPTHKLINSDLHLGSDLRLAPTLRYPYTRHFNGEGLPITIPASTQFARYGSGLVSGFTDGLRSFTAGSPTLLRSW